MIMARKPKPATAKVIAPAVASVIDEVAFLTPPAGDIAISDQTISVLVETSEAPVDEQPFLGDTQNTDGGISDETEAAEVKDPVIEEATGDAVQETPVLVTEEIKDETPAAPNDDEDKAANESEEPAADDHPPADDASTVPPVVEDTPPVDDETPPGDEASTEVPAVAVIAKPIAEWTLEEIVAFVKGEADKTGAVTEKEVVQSGIRYVKVIDANWEKWGFKDIYDWLKDDVLPVPTSGGFYLRDPARLNKSPHEWTEDELVDFLKGELPASKNAQHEDLEDMVRVKWRLVQPWSDAEVKEFVLLNHTPLLTENGYWKNDNVREQKPSKYWTTNELKAFAAGEIDGTANASEEELWVEIRNRFDVSQDFTVERLQQILAEYKEEELPMSLQFVRHNLDRYNGTMGKGVQVNEAGAAAAQGLFYSTVQRVLRLSGQEFVDGLTMILDFVHQHRTTMFDESHSYRGVAEMQSSDRDRRNHEQLLNLIIKTSNPETRYKEAKNTNFLAALNGIVDEEIRQRVLSYYQVG
jgi:hypothetical protein